MTSRQQAKEAPHSQESEMMVLGCMINNIDNLNIGAESLEEPDFYFTEHKIIFNVLKNSFEKEKPVDIHLISEELKYSQELQAIGSLEYLIGLSQYAGTGSLIEEYINNLKDKALLRNLIYIAQEMHKKSLDNPEDVTSLLEEYESRLKTIKKDKQLSENKLFEHLLEASSEEKITSDIRNTSSSISVGYKIGNVDLKIPGGALTFVVGPTGHGKTATLVNFSLGALKEHEDKSVYFFTYEENEGAITTLFLNTYINKHLSENNRSSIKSYFRDGDMQYMSQEGRKSFLEQKQDFFKNLIENKRLKIVYSEYSTEELIYAIKYLKQNTNVGLICIDYIQLLTLSKKTGNSRQEELKNICIALKNCAVETGLPLLIAAQFNRTVTNSSELSPTSIGEAGDIERIANTIIGFWNMQFAGIGENALKQTENKIYYKILKGREIRIGHESYMNFDGSTGKISNQDIKKEEINLKNFMHSYDSSEREFIGQL